MPFSKQYVEGIGGLQPSIVNSDLETGDEMVRTRLQAIGKSSKLLTLKQQKSLRTKMEKNPIFKDLLPGSPVLLDLPLKNRSMDKETHPKRGQIFIIDKWDLAQTPAMYRLRTVSGQKVRGKTALKFLVQCKVECSL